MRWTWLISCQVQQTGVGRQFRTFGWSEQTYDYSFRSFGQSSHKDRSYWHNPCSRYHRSVLSVTVISEFLKHNRRGVHFPWGHDAFPPVSDFPLFSKNFQTLSNIFKILPFPEKFLDFHPPKFLMTFFLVIDHKFQISPYFPCFSTFPPRFCEN